jgi:MFS family permease
MKASGEGERGKGFRGLRAVGRALAHRNFRLFFCGQSISLIGTWMQQVAMIWLVYELSGSPFWLGVVGFSSQIPAFVAAPVAGVLTDRWNRHRTVLGTPATILAFGLVSVAGSVVFALLLPGLRRVTRPIYVQAGLLPDAVPPIQPTASEIQSFPKA